MSPSDIELLLHCHCGVQPHDRADAPAIKSGIQFFLERGAIKPCERNSYYETTDLGQAWIRALCNVEAPTIAYVDERGNVL